QVKMPYFTDLSKYHSMERPDLVDHPGLAYSSSDPLYNPLRFWIIQNKRAMNGIRTFKGRGQGRRKNSPHGFCPESDHAL
ncbi:MAG: hypothetical protein P8Z73_05105, partial [Desulfobacteraceae bacterium]